MNPKSLALMFGLVLAAPIQAQGRTASGNRGGARSDSRSAKEQVKQLPPTQKLAVIIQALHGRLASRAPFNTYSPAERHANVIETLKLLGIPVNTDVPFAPGATAEDYAVTILAAAGDTGAAEISATLDRLVDTFFTEGEIATAAAQVADGSGIPGTDGGPDVSTEPGGNTDPDSDGLDPISLDELPSTFPVVISTVNQDTEFVDFGG